MNLKSVVTIRYNYLVSKLEETYPKPLAESDCADEFCITQNFQEWNRFFFLGILPDAEKMDLTKIPGDI